MAIVLLSSPVCAEEPLPILRASNTASELNPLLNSDSTSENYAIVNLTIEPDVDIFINEVVLNDVIVLDNEIVFDAASTPKQAATSLVTSGSTEPTDKPTDEPTDELTNKPTDELTDKPTDEPKPVSSLRSPPDRTAQADTPAPQDTLTPQPSEPSSNPVSDDAPEESLRERWQFSVEPYFFVPLNVRGDVTVAGRSASLDLGLDDILNLDRAFDAGLRLEAQRDRLGFILDAFYISAAQSGNVGVTLPEGSLQRFGINTAARVDGDVSLSVDELIVDAAVSYRVVDTVLGNTAESADPFPRLVVAPILGLRTRFLWQELEVDNVSIGDISLPIDREFSSSGTTIEPLLGAQIGLDLSERWAFNIRGDVSGFNLNAEEDFTWNLLVGTQYNLSPNISLRLAYRFNGFDFEDGEGLRRTRLNLYQNGLWLSGVFRF